MDKIDMKILNVLLDNCRESDRQIGKKIGISGGAVKTRIQKMLNKKIIEKFTLKIEPPVLGFKTVRKPSKSIPITKTKSISNTFLW